MTKYTRRMAYDPLLAWVMTALRKGWTPERIEGRLAVEFPDDPRMRVSHECLYQWCFASMFVRQVRQCFSAVWADGFPRCRHRFPVM